MGKRQQGVRTSYRTHITLMCSRLAHLHDPRTGRKPCPACFTHQSDDRPSERLNDSSIIWSRGHAAHVSILFILVILAGCCRTTTRWRTTSASWSKMQSHSTYDDGSFYTWDRCCGPWVCAQSPVKRNRKKRNNNNNNSGTNKLFPAPKNTQKNKVGVLFWFHWLKWTNQLTDHRLTRLRSDGVTSISEWLSSCYTLIHPRFKLIILRSGTQDIQCWVK